MSPKKSTTKKPITKKTTHGSYKKKSSVQENRANSILTAGIDLEDTSHHFMVRIPTLENEKVYISEHDLYYENPERQEIEYKLLDSDPRLKVILSLSKWKKIQEAIVQDFNLRLKRLGMKPVQFQAGYNVISRLFGKELVLLAWAIEEADPGAIDHAIENWRGLKPEERWWMYTMTNAATGQAVKNRNMGWRKAVRFALTENPLEL
jgi:hypothetical protein